jgi:hypothetical protein
MTGVDRQTRPETVKGLEDSRRFHIPGAGTASRDHLASLLAHGWTYDTYFQINRLGVHAARTKSWITQGGSTWNPGYRASDPPPYRVAEAAARHLLPIAETLGKFGSHVGWTPDVILAWTGLLAGATDAHEAEKLQAALRAMVPSMEGWLERLGEVGPLAWAAGLTVDEACTRHDVGTLDAADLVLLAQLRGFRLRPADR